MHPLALATGRDGERGRRTLPARMELRVKSRVQPSDRLLEGDVDETHKVESADAGWPRETLWTDAREGLSEETLKLLFLAVLPAQSKCLEHSKHP